MSLFQPDSVENPEFQTALQAEHAQIQADGIVQHQQTQLAGVMPPPIVLFTLEKGLERWTLNGKKTHRGQFPLSDHLFSLSSIAQADLIEQQREILTAHLSIR